MSFSLKRIFHNIMRRVGVYMIFMLEFAIGAAVLSSALNVMFSLQRDLKEAKAQMEDQIIEIKWHDTNWMTDPRDEYWITPWEEDIVINYDKYRKLLSLYGDDLEFRYALAGDISLIAFPKDESAPVAYSTYCGVYYINNSKFKELFGKDMEPGKIYGGAEAIERINTYLDYSQNPEYVLKRREDDYPMPFYAEDGKFKFCDGRVFDIVPTPPTERIHFIPEKDVNMDYEPVKLSEIVFLPIDEFVVYRDIVRKNFNPYNNYWESIETVEETDMSLELTMISHYTQPSVHSSLSVKITNPDIDVNTIPSMLTYLNSTSEEKEFSLDDEVLELERIADNVNHSVILQMIISGAVMLIVVLGTTGLFLIFLYKRKKEMAVSIAYGSTRKRLFFEIFSEVLFVTGIGTILGIAALKFTMEYATNLYRATTFQPASVVIPLLAALLCSFVTAALAFTGVGEIAPAKILKDL